MNQEDEQTVTDAVIVMIKNMARLKDAMGKGICVHSLNRQWSLAEAEVLALLPECDAEMLTHYRELLEAESEAILHAVPRRTSQICGLSSTEVRELCAVLPPQILAPAIEKSIVPAYDCTKILSHRPGDEEWTRYLEEVLSPVTTLKGNIGHIFWSSQFLGGVKLEPDVKTRTTIMGDLLDQMQSNHGALELHRKYPDLQTAVEKVCRFDHNSKNEAA